MLPRYAWSTSGLRDLERMSFAPIVAIGEGTIIVSDVGDDLAIETVFVFLPVQPPPAILFPHTGEFVPV